MIKLKARDRLAEMIETKNALVAVIGLGQAGLPAAVNMAKGGFSVVGYDIDLERINSIKQGKSYSEDVSNRDLRALLDSGRLIAKSSFATLSSADVMLIAVPTFITKQDTPDLEKVKTVASELVRHINKPTLVVLESTVYPGATEELLKSAFDGRNLKADEDYYLAYSPSRIDPGNEKWPLEKIPRIVAGLTPKSQELAISFYSKVIESVIPATNIKTAEITKLFENSFRAINIAFVDEMHMACRAMGLDIWEIIRLAETKPFGYVPFYPGPGIGGECIPVVPLYIAWKVRENGMRANFIELASEIIDMMPQFFIQNLYRLLNIEGKAVRNSKVLLIGVSYKKDMSDVRKSPALGIINLLEKSGAQVQYHDPLVPVLSFNGTRLRSAPLSDRLLQSQDAVVIVTDHSVIDFDLIVKNSGLILDTRNALAGYPDLNIHR